MSVARIASRYAKSLIELATERGELDKVREDIKYFNQVAEVKDFALLLKSPIIKADKKAKIFDSIFMGKVGELTKAFFDIIVKKGREPYLADIARAFVDQYKTQKRISSVTLTTAAPVSDGLVASIKQKLIEGKQVHPNIELETKIDPALLGGYVLEFDNKLYDASVAHKLEILRKEFDKNEYVKNL